MSCCLYWVILEERLSVRVLAIAVDSRQQKRKCSEGKACPSPTTSHFLEYTRLASKPGYQLIVYVMYNDSVRTSQRTHCYSTQMCNEGDTIIIIIIIIIP